MSLALIICLASPGRPLTAQEPTASEEQQQWSRAVTVMTGLEAPPSASVWPRLLDERWSPGAGGFVANTQAAGRRSSRDTLKNGAILGAIIGAAGFGALGAFTCHLHQEDGGASCLPDTLRVAAIGAAIGAGAGVAVDAALTRQGGIRVRVGVTF